MIKNNNAPSLNVDPFQRTAIVINSFIDMKVPKDMEYTYMTAKLDKMGQKLNDSIRELNQYDLE